MKLFRKAQMHLESYRRQWDLEDRRGALERIAAYFDANLEIFLVLTLFAVIGGVTIALIIEK